MIIIFASIIEMALSSIIINSANRLSGSYHSFVFPMSGLVFDKIKVDEVTLKMPAPYIDEFIEVTETDFFVSVDGENYVNAKISQREYKLDDLLFTIQIALQNATGVNFVVELRMPDGYVVIRTYDNTTKFKIKGHVPGSDYGELIGFTNPEDTEMSVAHIGNIGINYPLMTSRAYIEIYANVIVGPKVGAHYSSLTKKWFVGSVPLPTVYRGGEIVRYKNVDNSAEHCVIDIIKMVRQGAKITSLIVSIYGENGRLLPLDDNWTVRLKVI